MAFFNVDEISETLPPVLELSLEPGLSLASIPCAEESEPLSPPLLCKLLLLLPPEVVLPIE